MVATAVTIKNYDINTKLYSWIAGRKKNNKTFYCGNAQQSRIKNCGSGILWAILQESRPDFYRR